jgi:hypothetical protein
MPWDRTLSDRATTTIRLWDIWKLCHSLVTEELELLISSVSLCLCGSTRNFIVPEAPICFTKTPEQRILT